MWGSFLNVLALDILYAPKLLTLRRSCCPICHTHLAWYDLVPVFSWLYLRAKCRSCKQPISVLYIFIELLSLVIGLLSVYYTAPSYWLTYALLHSALIVTVRTDLQAYGVWQGVTLYLIPVGLLAAYGELLPIGFFDSLLGCITAYLFLYTIRAFFYWYRNVEGLGMGDVELLSMIGSFVGLQGWWWALLVGALCGSFIGIVLIAYNKNKYRNFPIPFCPFLALGTWIYLFFIY